MRHVNGDVAVKYVIERESIGTHTHTRWRLSEIVRQDDSRGAAGRRYRPRTIGIRYEKPEDLVSGDYEDYCLLGCNATRPRRC
jgi:hypothetical protein